MTQNAEVQIKKAVRALKRNPKVMAILIFGSYIKRKMKPLSDIDIAVITKNPDLNTEAEVTSISSNILDIVNFHRVPAYIQFDILKTGKPLFVRDKDFFVQTKVKTLRVYLDAQALYKTMEEAIMVC